MQTLESERGHRLLRPAAVATLGLIAVAAALVWAILRPREEPAPPPAAPPALTQPQTPAGATAAAAAPRFDVARISAQGDTVIAGRAAPRATVRIDSNGRPLGSVTADGRGEWVFVPDAPLPPGAHRLTLAAQMPAPEGGKPADDGWIAGEGEVLIVVPAGGRDIAGRPDAGARPLAILIPGDGGETAPHVLQKPSGGEAAAPAAIGIDLVEYDGASRLALSGRAAAGASVRIFVDDTPVGSAVADADGRWSLTVRRPGLATTHSLRAETGDSSHASRFVGRLLLAPAAGRTDDGKLVVEPGQNLWRIARETYGRGTAYTIIYDANRGRIEDPDLIYPGQALSLPPPPAAGSAP